MMDLSAILTTATAHLRCRRWTEALENYQRALALHPECAAALYGWAVTLDQLGRWVDATDALTKARLWDDEPPADLAAMLQPLQRVARGQQEQQNNNLRAALQLFETAEEMRPDNSRAARYGRIQTLRLLGKTAAALALLDPEDDAEEFQLERGWLLLEDQRYPEAQEVFARLHEHAGSKYRLLVVIGLTASLRLQDKPREARELLEQVKADWDQQAGLHVEAGFLDLLANNASSALSHFVQARSLAPDSVEAVVGQSRALRKRRLLPDAAAALNTAPRPDADSVRIERGFLLLDQRESQQAQAEFDRVLAEHPNHALAIAGKNRALRQQGQTAEAARLVVRAAHQAPLTNARVHRMLGEFAYDEHRYVTALDEFSRAIAENDRSADTLRWRCRMLRLLCRFSAAEEEALTLRTRFPDGTGDRHALDLEAAWLAFDRQRYAEAECLFSQLYPDPVSSPGGGLAAWTAVLRAQRKFDRAAEVLIEVELHPGEEGSLAKEWGWLAYDRRDYEEAAARFTAAVAVDPGDAEARRWLAAAHREAGRYEQAGRELAGLGELAPTDPWRYQEEGWLDYDQGLYDEARTCFERSLTYHPTDERSLCGKSATLRAQQRFPEAKDVVRTALDTLPESPALRCELALIDLTTGRPRDAVRRLTDLASGLGKDARFAGEVVLAALIAALVADGDVASGLRKAEEALAELPDSPVLRSAYGWALLAGDERLLGDAEDAFRRVLQESPRHPAATYGLVQTLLRRGDVEGAAREIESVAQKPNADPQRTKALAVVRFQQDRYESALALLDVAGLQADPEAQQCATAALRMLRRYAESADRARLALEHSGSHLGLRLELARSLLGQRRYDEAEAEFERVRTDQRGRRSQSTNDSATIGRSECLRRLKRHGVAEAMLREPAQESNCFALRIELARVYYEQREPARAKKWFDEVLDRTPRDSVGANAADRAAALAGLALIEMDMDHWPEAEKRLREAVETCPKSLSLRVLQAWFFLRRADRTDPAGVGSLDYLQRAEDEAESVLVSDPYSASALASLGVVALRRGQFQAAESFLTRAITLDPFSSYYVPLAAVLTEVGRYDDAVQRLRDHLNLTSGWYDTQAHLQLGATLLRAHRPREAVDELRIAATLSPDDVAVTTELAAALVENERAADAEQLLSDRLRHEKSDFGKHDLRLSLTLGWVLLKRAEVANSADLWERAVRHLDEWKSRGEDPEFFWYSAYAHAKLAEAMPWRRALDRESARRDLATYSSLLRKNQGRRRTEAEPLREQLRRHPTEVLSNGLVWAGLSVVLLIVLWSAFLSDKKGVDATLVAGMTPVLLALALVASALPVVSKLRVVGVEAEMREAHPVPQQVSATINFPHIAAVVTARETLWTGAPDPVEHLAQELTGYMLPARPLTTSGTLQKSVASLSEILQTAGMPSGGPSTVGAALAP